MVLENTTEHEITISTASPTGIQAFIIPASKQNPENRNELIHGQADVDMAVVGPIRDRNLAVASYFESGDLREMTVRAEKKDSKGKA